MFLTKSLCPPFHHLSESDGDQLAGAQLPTVILPITRYNQDLPIFISYISQGRKAEARKIFPLSHSVNTAT